MIKICFVTTISLTLKSFVLETAKFLHSTGDFDITMICSSDSEFQKQLPSFIKFIPIDMKRGVSFDGFKTIIKLKKIFKAEKFDIVQYSTPNASCYASIASKKAKIPVRLYCQWGIAYVGFSGIKRFILKQIERHTCRCSTWIEPDSKSNLIFSHNEKLYRIEKGSVVWNGSACGVNLDKFDISKKPLYRIETRKKLSIPDSSFVFGFVGRITRDKGINELFEAYKRLGDDSYLIMIGPSEIDSTINEDLMTWAKNCPNIIFTGYVGDVEKYISSMDCYILPSYREGFGLGVVESEAMGVPVIVTNIPGPIDGMIHEKTGFVIEKKDSDALYERMKYIKQMDKSNYDFLSKNSVEFATKNFDQKTMFRKIEQDRKELLNKIHE